MKRLAIAAFLGIGALTGLAMPAQGAPVTICHATGSATNPFSLITIDDNALPAHFGHGDFLPAPDGSCTAPTAVPLTPETVETLFDFGPDVDASGGDGGSARGGDGGRGGSGTLAICNQNSNDVTWEEWWEDDELVSDEPTVNCAAGGRGGEGGDAGISEGGDGGVAFNVGGTPTATPIFDAVGFA